jgi:putative DNA primase/helicase
MGAPRERWDRFLEKIFPSAELRDFMQRAVGYSTLGLTREQSFFVCYGTGANGKSVFLNTILRVLGTDYATQADPASFLVRTGDRIRADIARLRGVRFVSAIETGDGKRLDEAMIKAATGGESLVGEFKYQNQFVFMPQFHLWLATNHRPRIDGTDYGIWRRVLLIPFTVTIPEDKRDRDLDAKLVRESEGILDWIITGACRYLRDGLNPPGEVRAATKAYRQSEDVIGRYIAECTISGAAMQVSKAALFTAFGEWCDREGERVSSKKKFGQYVAEQGFDEYRDGPVRHWIGLGLRADA